MLVLGFFVRRSKGLEEKKIKSNTEILAVAALLSEGEIVSNIRNEFVLQVPFDRKKSMYLSELIRDSNIKSHMDINLKKDIFILHSHPILEKLKKQWYQGQTKIFSKSLDPKLITVQSIIIAINLFGTRKLESVSIPTNIDKEYLRTISFCMEHHLKVPVIPSTNHIKFTNVPKFIQNSIFDIPAIHSIELVNFLTEKEKKMIMEGHSYEKGH